MKGDHLLGKHMCSVISRIDAWQLACHMLHAKRVVHVFWLNEHHSPLVQLMLRTASCLSLNTTRPS